MELLFADSGVFRWLTQSGTIQVDAFLFAVSEILTSAKDRICQNPFRVMPAGHISCTEEPHWDTAPHRRRCGAVDVIGFSGFVGRELAVYSNL